MSQRSIIVWVGVVAVIIAAGWYVDSRQVVMPMPTATTSGQAGSSYGPAPEFTGITGWLNSAPLTMAGLRGKVVLVDFWTYSCINCIRTLPYVTKWYDTYHEKGFVVVGVHTPEFAFEQDANNVKDAIARFGIHYPVAQDNDYGTWKAYQNEYWPAEYLIDQSGNIVHEHFGEGEYDVTENAIRTLLGLPAASGSAGPDLNGIQSPEMYFGTDRQQYYVQGQTPKDLNTFTLQGQWQFTSQYARLDGATGTIVLKFHSAKVFLVASSAVPALVSVIVDGKAQPSVTVKDPKLYTLFDSDEYTDHTIEITVPQSGFQAFTFTFG